MRKKVRLTAVIERINNSLADHRLRLKADNNGEYIIQDTSDGTVVYRKVDPKEMAETLEVLDLYREMVVSD